MKIKEMFWLPTVDAFRTLAEMPACFEPVTGDVAAVQSAVDAAAAVVGQKGMLVNKVVIPSPRKELLNEMI